MEDRGRTRPLVVVKAVEGDVWLANDSPRRAAQAFVAAVVMIVVTNKGTGDLYVDHCCRKVSQQDNGCAVLAEGARLLKGGHEVWKRLRGVR